MSETSVEGRRYFCHEPWTGIFDLTVDQDVLFCPCYLQLRIGNLRDAPLLELWNGPELQEMRALFAAGALPPRCEGQLCPTVLGEPLPDD